jgi:hypothetical protein
MLERIAKPGPGDTIETLRALPDRSLPSLDGVLAANLLGPDDDDQEDLKAALVERYATGAVEGSVARALDAALDEGNCEVMSALVAYLARVDRSAGRDALSRMRATGPDHCASGIFQGLRRFQVSPAIEEAAIDSLTAGDPSTVEDAAEILGASGSAAAREPLLKALERWHAAWEGHAATLQFNRMNAEWRQAGVENALIDALTMGHGWRTTQTDLERLLTLCVTDDCRTRITDDIDRAKSTKIRVWYMDTDSMNLELAQYNIYSVTELEARLRQYPKGTAFTLDVHQLNQADAAAVASKIAEMAKRYDLIVR